MNLELAALRGWRCVARGGAAARGGCAALVKAFDGPRWFDQGRAWREIAAEMKANGAGGWGYRYGNDPAGEAQRAIETARYGQAGLLVLDVEAEFKSKPRAADALGPEYPLYFSSFAIARFHRSFPFEIFGRCCTGTVPQVYWNAFRWPVDQSLDWTYEDYAALDFAPEQVFPAVASIGKASSAIHIRMRCGSSRAKCGREGRGERASGRTSA